MGSSNNSEIKQVNQKHLFGDIKTSERKDIPDEKHFLDAYILPIKTITAKPVRLNIIGKLTYGENKAITTKKLILATLVYYEMLHRIISAPQYPLLFSICDSDHADNQFHADQISFLTDNYLIAYDELKLSTNDMYDLWKLISINLEYSCSKYYTIDLVTNDNYHQIHLKLKSEFKSEFSHLEEGAAI